MSEIQDNTTINPTNDLFLCAICGQVHPSATIFCEQTGRVILPAEMIPFEDTIECPFCGNPHQKELHYCPETGQLMPIVETHPLEITQPMNSKTEAPVAMETFVEDDEEDLETPVSTQHELDNHLPPVTKTVVPTRRYGVGNGHSEKRETSVVKPIQPQTSSKKGSQQVARSSNGYDREEELARYRVNQSMMMVVIAVLLVGLIVAGFFIFQLTQQVGTLESTVSSMQEMLTELYAKVQVMGQ